MSDGGASGLAAAFAGIPYSDPRALERLLSCAGVWPEARRRLGRALAGAGVLPTELAAFLYVRSRGGQGSPGKIVRALQDPTAVPRAVRLARARRIGIPDLMYPGNPDLDPGAVVSRVAARLTV